MNRLRIEGIYDLQTLKMIEGLGIVDLGFDFRPRSFNFLQLYSFLEILNESFDPKKRYFLRFENEPDFVVKKFIEDIDQCLLRNEQYHGFSQHFILEFSDSQSFGNYDQYDQNYYWHYRPDMPSLQGRGLKGVVLNFDFLYERHSEGTFSRFFNDFLQSGALELKLRGIELILAIDWHSNLFPSLFDFIDYDLMSLCINDKIEQSYRNVDLTKAGQSINFYKNLQL